MNMNKRTIAAAAIIGLGSLVIAAPAQAGPTDPRDNTGYCVSDIFYGNQPNLDADGNVVASQSPGPKRTLPDGTVVQGNSVGDYAQNGVNIAQLCHAAMVG